MEVLLLERTYREHRPAALRLARRLLPDAQLAEDAVEQAFMRIIPMVMGGDVRSLQDNPRAMVMCNTRWEALNILHRRRMRGDAERRFGREAAPSGIDDWVQSEARVLCTTILGHLPRGYAQILRARYVYQYPDQVAAERLRLSVDTYRYRLRCAVQAARLSAARQGLRRPSAWRLVLGIGLGRPRRRMRLRHLVARGVAGGLARWQVALVVGGVVGALVLQHPIPTLNLQLMPSASAPRGAGAAAFSTTPNDVLVYSAAVSRRSAGTVVAVGFDGRCACEVLLQSTDGARTWQTGPGPQRATTVVLPSAYPADPRIFVAGGDRIETTARFGALFSSLPGASGLVALDPLFDSGRPWIYVARDRSLQRIDVVGRSVHRLPVPGAVVQLTAIAAVAGPHTSTVLVLGRRSDGRSLLLSCSPQSCTMTAPSLSGAPDRLAVITDDNTAPVVVAYQSSQALLVSRDGGATFTAEPLPPDSQSVMSVVVGRSADGRPGLWALVDAGGRGRLMAMADLAGRWQPAIIRGDDRLPPTGTLAALGSGSVLDLLQGHGLICAAAGAAWWAACPAA